MARVRGRDVVIDLMDAVTKLETTSTRHAEHLESLAYQGVAMRERLGEVSERLGEVSERLGEVSARLDEVSARLDEVSARLDEVSERVGSLEDECHSLAEGFVQSAQLSRTIEQQVKRVGRLLSDFAGVSKTRFDDLEGRLKRVERKTG